MTVSHKESIKTHLILSTKQDKEVCTFKLSFYQIVNTIKYGNAHRSKLKFCNKYHFVQLLFTLGH